MTEKLDLYKCNICGNTVQVLLNGIGELVCCGEKMEHLIPHTEENPELTEKHTPVFEKRENEQFVTLKYHPMIPEHYIQFIETFSKDKNEVHLKYLYPNEKAESNISCLKGDLEALELCNIHGLWRSQNG